jgi:hypothetical protein
MVVRFGALNLSPLSPLVTQSMDPSMILIRLLIIVLNSVFSVVLYEFILGTVESVLRLALSGKFPILRH